MAISAFGQGMGCKGVHAMHVATPQHHLTPQIFAALSYDLGSGTASSCILILPSLSTTGVQAMHRAAQLWRQLCASVVLHLAPVSRPALSCHAWITIHLQIDCNLILQVEQKQTHTNPLLPPTAAHMHICCKLHTCKRDCKHKRVAPTPTHHRLASERMCPQ